ILSAEAPHWQFHCDLLPNDVRQLDSPSLVKANLGFSAADRHFFVGGDLRHGVVEQVQRRRYRKPDRFETAGAEHLQLASYAAAHPNFANAKRVDRSEEHTSELQSRQ